MGKVCSKANNPDIRRLFVENGDYQIKLNIFKIDTFDAEYIRVAVNDKECFKRAIVWVMGRKTNVFFQSIQGRMM